MAVCVALGKHAKVQTMDDKPGIGRLLKDQVSAVPAMVELLRRGFFGFMRPSSRGSWALRCRGAVSAYSKKSLKYPGQSYWSMISINVGLSATGTLSNRAR